MNDNFFTYYSKEPLKKKFCKGFLSKLIFIFHIYLIPLNLISHFILRSNDKENFIIVWHFLVVLFLWDYYTLFSLALRLAEKTSQFLRIDMIYSKEFDRLFIGVVKNDESAYIITYLFKLDEVDKFVIEKNKINEPGFHLRSIDKRNCLVQDICYINETPTELEGLMYILNEKLQQNADNINNNKNSMVNNATNDNAGITDSPTPLTP